MFLEQCILDLYDQFYELTSDLLLVCFGEVCGSLLLVSDLLIWFVMSNGDFHNLGSVL